MVKQGDNPEVYDKFARVPREPHLFKHIVKMFDFSEKELLDVDYYGSLDKIIRTWIYFR